MFGTAEIEDRDSGKDNSAVGKLLLAILGIPLIPAAAVGLFLYWLLLRKLKFRRSMSLLVTLVLVAISGLAIEISSAFDKFMGSFTMAGGIVENWQQTLWLLAPMSLALGALFGLGVIIWEVRDIHNNPHKVELPGFWTYNLKWRKTPLESLRKKKAIKALREGSLISEERAPLGYEEDADRVGYRYAEEAIRHTLVTGAAGSGKTISMLAMMRADIEAGRTIAAVDFKRSPEFAAKLASWSHEFGIPFYHFEKGKPESYRIEHSLGQSTYDPFASGSGSEMVLNMRDYDTASAVYKGHMQQLLQVVFAMMEQADRKKAPNLDWSHGGIYQLSSALTDANLRDLLTACENRPIFNEAEDYIARATAGKGMENHSLEELRGQMRTIVASAYGRWFKIGDGTRNIDLLELLTGKQAIVLFSFNSEDEPELSRYVGSMIFADLRAVSSQIRNMKADKITNIYVDEFQAVPPTAVNGLLEKARESKLAMTLAQQAFEQIITSAESNGEAYLQSILVTCSNFLTHAGMTQDSAERVSKLLGKEWKTVYSRTNKTDGGFLKNNFSNRRNQIVSASKQEVWRVEPAEFMALSAPSSANNYRSTAILVSKAVADPNVPAEGTISRKLWMIPPSCVLEEYVKPLSGNEVNAIAQNLYVDGSAVPFLSEEEQLLQKSYLENTPVYIDDSISPVQVRSKLENTEEYTDKDDFIEGAFDGFGQDSDGDDDGDFGIAEIPDDSNNDLDAGLSAFDDFNAQVRPSNQNIVRSRPKAQQSQKVKPAIKQAEASYSGNPLKNKAHQNSGPTSGSRSNIQSFNSMADDDYEEEGLPDI